MGLFDAVGDAFSAIGKGASNLWSGIGGLDTVGPLLGSVAGGALGGLTGMPNLASGLAGAGHKKASKRMAREQLNLWKKYNTPFDQQVQTRVSDARKAGLHPLAALGMSGVASGTPPMGGVPGGTASFGGGSPVRHGMSSADRKIAEGREQALFNARLQESQSVTRLNEARTAATLLDARSRTVAATANSSQDGPALEGVTIAGRTLPRRPNIISNAEDFQTYYGDIVENIAGAGALVVDLGAAQISHAPRQLEAVQSFRLPSRLRGNTERMMNFQEDLGP